MANNFWGGFAENLGPAMQEQRQSSLKQKIMEMQMLEYQQKQEALQGEAAVRGQKQQLLERWKSAPPEQRAAIEREISLSQGHIPGQTVAEQMRDYQAAGGMPGGGGASGGNADNPYGQSMDMNPTFGPRGMSITGSVHHPAGKLGEVGAYLQSIGADPHDKAAQVAVMQAFSMSGEAQAMEMQRVAQQYGGRGGQPARQPQQEEGIEAVGPDGKPMYFDNRATYDEAVQRRIVPGQGQSSYQPGVSGVETPQYAGGGSPYDVIRGKETAAAIQRAGGEAGAREQNTVVGPEERNTLDSLKASNNLVDTMLAHPVPSATGVLQGSKLARAVGTRSKPGLGGNTDAQTAYYVQMEELENVIGLSRGGKTFTPQEQARLEAILPTSDMSDREVKARLGEVKKIFGAALERQTNMITSPRSQTRENLRAEEPANQKRRAGAGGPGGLTPKAQDYLERITGGQ